MHQQIHDIEREVAFAARRLESQQRDANLARRRVALLEKRADALEKRYDADDEQTDVTTIAEVKLNEIEAQIELDRTIGTYAETLVRLQRVLGRTLAENAITVN